MSKGKKNRVYVNAYLAHDGKRVCVSFDDGNTAYEVDIRRREARYLRDRLDLFLDDDDVADELPPVHVPFTFDSSSPLHSP